MPKEFLKFANRMRKRADELQVIASEVAKAGAEAGLRDLVEVTPVDTSTALSNWRIGIGSRPMGEIDAHVPGQRGSTRLASAGEAIDEGKQSLSSKQPGQPIYLSNAVHYIGDLDRGSSTQFSGGFLPRALIIIRLAVQEKFRELMRKW